MATVLELITDALYLSGVVALEFETPNDTEESVGLRLLNGIILENSTDGNMIPYNEFHTFNTVIGTPNYFVPGLVELESLAYVLDGNVRFPINRDSTTDYFSTARVEGVESIPSEYYVKRLLGGSQISFYFTPNQVLEVQVFGKFSQDLVTINQELDDIFDGYYQKWLKYELQYELLQYYNQPINPEVEKKLKIIRSKIFQLEGLDLTLRKMPLSERKPYPDFWYNANFTKGFTP